MSARLVVLASGEGSTLQAVLDACAAGSYGADVVALGTDRPGVRALERADAAGVSTFVVELATYRDREAWDWALAAKIGEYQPDLVVCAGFMKIVGEPVLAAFADRMVNTHPTLLPAFPGAHGVRDALAHGVKVAGATVHLVTAALDDGPILGQAVVEVRDDDDEASLHARIKAVEAQLYVDTIGRMAREGWTVTGRKVRFGR